MNRQELDAFVEHHALSPPAARAALDLSRARPTAQEVAEFVVRVLFLAGVLSIAFGVVFFVAANWDALAVLGRFALTQTVLVACVALALWRTPPHGLGRNAALMAFIMTGVLLALFGQTYQTGADTYELFLGWAVLGLPFAAAAQWSVACAAWLMVLDVALLLFFGWRPETGWLWLVFAGWRGLHPAAVLLVPTVPNLLVWLASQRLGGTRFAHLVPRWLGRLALAWAVGFATWSGALAIFEGGAGVGGSRATSLGAVIALLAGIAAYAVRARRDVFPLAAVAGGTIALVTFALVEHLGFGDLGMFFSITLWLVASSTFSGQLLMSRVRAWRREEARS
jgi:uncharacterized membrane protein